MTVDPEDAPRVLNVDRDYVFGELHGCLLVIWRGQPKEESYRERARFMLDLAKRFPGRCGVIEVIESSSKAPSPAARSVIAQSMQEVGKALSGMAIVVEGNELRSTFVRAVLAGLQLLVRGDQPMRVDKDPMRSAEWLCEMMHVADASIPKRLVAAIETLRSEIPRG